MKKDTAMKKITATVLAFAFLVSISQIAAEDVRKEELKSISTPDQVQTTS